MIYSIKFVKQTIKFKILQKLLFSGELPPRSVNGVANSNEININLLSERFYIFIDEEYVDLRYHGVIGSSKFISLLIRLKRILSLSVKNKFDFFYIVFSTSTAGAFKTLVIIILFKIFNSKTICVVHLHRGDLDLFVKRSILNKLLFKCVIIMTKKIIVLSDQTRNYIEAEFDRYHDVFVLPNTVEEESYLNFSEKKNTPRKNHKQFVFISNYIQEKGILLLLECFVKLDDNFRLNCFGNFSDPKLESKILSYASNRIKINGPIFGKEKFLELQRSDALILPSFNEGKPLVLLESLLVGTPFIAPKVGYIEEMVFDNYPFLYEENTLKDLMDIIVKFTLFDKDEMLVLQESLSKHYFENNSNSKHKKKLLEIFQ